MATWQLQDAKARLSEVIDTAKRHGPQVITQRGVMSAVLVPYEQWNRISHRTSLLDNSEREKSLAFLKVLQSGPQFDLATPPRGRLRLRKPMEL